VIRRILALSLVLAVTALVVPQASVRHSDAALVRVRTAEAVDHPRTVVWVLCLGSDARPGERVTRSRADAIQLVGLNLDTGDGTVIGIPRDSYVVVRGGRRDKINSAMSRGGPQLMAEAVSRLVGVRPDYVLTTGFLGFRAMVRAIGGVTVDSEFAFADAVRPQGYAKGRNRLNPFQALIFGRVRHPLPHGDFDRSANQQELLRAILRKVRAHQDTPGFLEKGVLAAAGNLDTDLRPAQLYRLALAATRVRPDRVGGCVVRGRAGYAGLASVVHPDVAQARRIGDDARRDGRLDRGCR
jgi:LCP family protein required for cell wall assembly